MTKPRLVEDASAEVLRDGQWEELHNYSGVFTLDTPFVGHHRLMVGSHPYEVEVVPPWRLLINGDVVAEQGLRLF